MRSLGSTECRSSAYLSSERLPFAQSWTHAERLETGGRQGPRVRRGERCDCVSGRRRRKFVHEKEYANFVLRFEFKLSPGGNNGIGIRAPLEGQASYQGMEIQILDDADPKYQSRIKPAQYHGSIYDVVPAEHGFKKPTGEWNSEEITADGRQIKVVLNGHTLVDANLDDVKDPEVLKKHPGLQRNDRAHRFPGTQYTGGVSQYSNQGTACRWAEMIRESGCTRGCLRWY